MYTKTKRYGDVLGLDDTYRRQADTMGMDLVSI